MMIPVQVQGFVKIFDPVSGEVFVDKKNKPMYANYMTETGVKFYSQIAQQAMGAAGQLQQQ